MNLVFANQDDEDTNYPLTTREIAEAQKRNLELNTMTDKYGYTTQLVENSKVLCKNGKMVILTSLQPINESDIADFLTNATWAVCSTYHTVLKTSPVPQYLEGTCCLTSLS